MSVIACQTSWYPKHRRARVRDAAATSPIAPSGVRAPRRRRAAPARSGRARGAPRGARRRAASRTRCRGTRRSGGSMLMCHKARIAPPAAMPHARTRNVMPHAGSSASSVTGVYEPAISTKIIAWSRRCSRALISRRPMVHVVRAARAEQREQREDEQRRRDVRGDAAARRDEQHPGRDREHERDLVQPAAGAAAGGAPRLPAPPPPCANDMREITAYWSRAERLISSVRGHRSRAPRGSARCG